MSVLRHVTVLSLVCLAACHRKAGDDTSDSGEDVSSCATGLTAADVAGGTWDSRFTIAGFTGHDGLAPTVYDFATDVDGSLVATGRFQWIGDEAVEPLARWRDGAWEPARADWELTPALTGFSAIAISEEGHLALATYDTFGDRAGEIWVDDGTGLRSIGPFDGLVRSLAWFDGELWVAGLYTMGDPAIAGLATWDGDTWAPAPGGALDGAAFELTVDDGELLVGGAFTAVGGVPAANVAAWNGVSWRALDLPDALAVYALARGDDGELYVGGAIVNITSGTGGVARWDGTTWQVVGGGLSMYSWPGVVTDLVSYEGTLAATGCFITAGGPADGPGTVPARSVARWDGVAWEGLDDDSAGVLGPWLEPGVCGDEGLSAVWDVSYQRLASTGDTLLVGGSFPGAGGVLSQSIIGYADDTWIAQGTDGLGIGGAIDRVAAAGEDCDEVYATGTFTHAGGVSTSARLLHFTGDGWQPVDDDIPADAWCPGLAASADGDVAVGCMAFPADGGDAVGRIYRKVGDRLDPVDAELPPIQDLTYDTDGRLWVVGGGATGFLAQLDGETLTTIEADFDGPVTRVDVGEEDDVIVGGSFSRVGDVAASRIARWDGTSWEALGEGAPGMVAALARDATHVYVSSYDEGGGAWMLGAWDGARWTELATPEAGLTPPSYFNFDRIQPIDDALLLVGSAELDEGEGRGALVYQDGAFTPLGGAVRGMNVSDIQISPDAIWFAGSIAEVGAGPTLAPSVGVARYVVGR